MSGTLTSVDGKYLVSYAIEMAWREDHRRVANGTLVPACRQGRARPSGQPPVEGILAALGMFLGFDPIG